MRPDNRARSRRTAREAASNPPPLKHLAHYLSIFVSLFIFILPVFSRCIFICFHCFINNTEKISLFRRRISINKLFVNEFLHFCKVHNINCVSQQMIIINQKSMTISWRIVNHMFFFVSFISSRCASNLCFLWFFKSIF